MAMRRWLMPAIFQLCLVFFLASWTGTAGLGVALAYEQPQKGVPKPQPIPHRHDRECENPAQKEPAAPRIADCLDYRAECHCARPCVREGDRCGSHCWPRLACDADRDEPCRRPEGDNDGEKHTASPY